MPSPPNDAVLEAFIAASSRIERRVEICEFDGVTPWKPDLWDSLLVDGAVGVSYDSAERRTIDLTLDNYDGELDHRPGNLWYDKVFKVFYGIHVDQQREQPSILIIEEYDLPGQAVLLKELFTRAGYTRVRINTEAGSMLSLVGYDIIVALSADYIHKAALLLEAFQAGKSVLTFALTATAGQLPLLVGAAESSVVALSSAYTLRAASGAAHPVQTGWADFTVENRRALYRTSFDDWPADWTRASESPAEIDPALAQDGTASLRIPAGRTRNHLQRLIPVTPGERLQFSIWGYAGPGYNGTNSNSKIRIANGPTLITGVGFGATNLEEGSWTQVTGAVTVPDGATELTVQLYTDHSEGTVWLDRLDIARIETSPQVRRITAPAPGATVIGSLADPARGTSAAVLATERAGAGRWVHVQHTEFDPARLDDATGQLAGLVGAATGWLDAFEPIGYWETQIGEFVPEQISVDGANEDLIRITGKDYTKRCQASALPTATTFTRGTPILGIISAMASNAKCFKTALPPLNALLPKDITYESKTDRWQIMKDLADSAGYEIYFDARGQLTMRPYQDPLLTPASLILSSGRFGNLVSKASTASDTSLRNYIVVRGESSDSTVLPVWAVAKNTKPTSPASIEKIGERYDEYSSPLYTTTAQCQEMANNLLRVASLEEFSMDFSAILFPWVDVGEILELAADDTYSQIGEPQRFLITSLSLPLDLGPMSGTGKRVTIVV